MPGRCSNLHHSAASTSTLHCPQHPDSSAPGRLLRCTSRDTGALVEERESSAPIPQLLLLRCCWGGSVQTEGKLRRARRVVVVSVFRGLTEPHNALLLFQRRARFPSFDSCPCPVCTCAERRWECAHAQREARVKRTDGPLRPRNRTRCRQNRNTRPKAVVALPRPGTWRRSRSSSRTTCSPPRRLESTCWWCWMADGAAWWPPLRKEFLPSCLERLGSGGRRSGPALGFVGQGGPPRASSGTDSGGLGTRRLWQPCTLSSLLLLLTFVSCNSTV